MLKRQRTYLAQEPEAAGWMREGIPVACLPVTLAKACTVQKGLNMGQRFHCAGCPGRGATQWLTYYEESTWPQDGEQADWTEGSWAVTQRNLGRLQPASVGAAHLSLRRETQLPACFLINILSCLWSRSQASACSLGVHSIPLTVQV